MSCYIVQEIDGSSRFTLEDSSGFLLQEDCIPIPPGGPAVFSGDKRPPLVPDSWGEPWRNKRKREQEDEDLISVILDSL